MMNFLVTANYLKFNLIKLTQQSKDYAKTYAIFLFVVLYFLGLWIQE
jgi:hypothetical protein